MNRRWVVVVSFVLIVIIAAVAFGLKKTRSLALTESKEPVIGPEAVLLNQAKQLEAKGNLLEAKAVYQKAINDYPGSNDIMISQKKTEDLNIKLLFSPTITPKSALYTIKPGDTLTKISKEFKTTVELIKRSNHMADDRIVPGRKIKVWTGQFSIVVDKSQNVLMLKSDEEVFKTYIVATGANNHTPAGTFKIASKLPNPTWFKTGAVVPASSPENVLGTRWLGFDYQGYGIHGTIEPQTLGKQVTQGCVRMSNSDVEELYDIVPVGTNVTIVD